MRIRNLARNFFYIFFALLMILPAVSLAQPAHVEAATQAEINAAIVSGVAWVAARQNVTPGPTFGRFDLGDTFYAANTAFAVAVLEHYAEQIGTTPLNPSYVYSTNVQNGLNYLFSVAEYDAVNHWVWWEDDSTFHNAYMTGPCLLPIARCGAPTAVVSGGLLNGLTYKQVAQYTVDWLYSAQVPSGINIGGWYYNKQTGPDYYGDQSVVGWVTMGLGYAAHSMGCTIPPLLLNRLSQWNTYIQCKTPGDSFNGAGYTEPCSWVNSYKTGGLLFGDALCGDTATIPRVVDALSFLNTYWDSPTNGYSGAPDAGWRGASPPTPASDPRPSYLATISITKGLTELGITTFSGHDWYQDFAEVIVRTQHADKSWTGGGYDEEECPGRSTCWALLTLLKVHSAPPPPPPPPCTPPTITAIDPARGSWGQSLTVVITGANFSGATAVSFGTGITVDNFTVDSATQITAKISIPAISAVGPVNVTVTTPCNTATSANGFFLIPQQATGPGGGSASATGTSKTYDYTPVPLAAIAVQSASLSAKAVTPGTPVTVTADIANKSTVNGNKKVTLYVNGQVETAQGVTVNSGSSSKLTFDVARSEPGDYSVYVDGVPAGSFKVEMVTGNDGILIFSAILIAAALIAGMVMLWRRQRTV